MFALRITLATIAAVGLAINAIIHVQLAAPYDGNPGALLGQGNLFRIQAVANLVVAVLLIVTLRFQRAAFVVAIAAAAVAAGGLAMVVITALVPLDLTVLGLPYLFEPIWFADKIVSAVAQGIALIAAVIIAALSFRRTGAIQP